ncbi:MAG: sensor histidine kinase [Hyphomicrobiales bacterium]|nr:MAG: sensor histidine kinase [Hyphomicrobiales bacterium]
MNRLTQKQVTRPLWITAIVLLLFAASFSGYSALERYFQLQLAQKSDTNLRLAVAGLRGALGRYEPVSKLIAEKESVKLLLTNTSDTAQIDQINNELRRIAKDVNASDIYVMDLDGLTWAASNFDQPRTFIGRSYNYRPYFQQASKGQLGRFFALGTASNIRGYYFAYPVKQAERIIGVVTTKVTVDQFEADWKGGDAEIIVTDTHGIVFMSSRDEWRFKSLDRLDKATLNNIEQSRQYPIERLSQLQLQRKILNEKGVEHIQIGTGRDAKNYVVATMAMPEADWSVHILTPTSSAITQAYTTMFIIVLLLLSGGLIAAFVRQRRAQFFERLETQRLAQEMLERRVEERTADLNIANDQLRLEVDERVAAEQQLRQTQAELVQAGKLAALGQMSAALSHEFNQPLAAVKSYADNAAIYLDRDRPKDARDNISRISQMADRMASISKHLRNFARRPQDKSRPVLLNGIIDDAINLASAKLSARGISIAKPEGCADIWVQGGQVRLQQVLLNLISNALDATPLSETSEKIIISLDERGDQVHLSVRDFGTGLSEEILEQVFDPFFTTKGPGKGLGLGLSISFNIIKDFDGDLRASNHPDGGAIFTILLNRANSAAKAAAE